MKRTYRNLYLPSGYWDFQSALDPDCPFVFVIGGRATGKTYGALQGVKEHFDATGRSFIYMRRTKTQADLVSTDVFNPFTPLNKDHGWNIQPGRVTKGVHGFYNMINTGDRLEPAGPPLGTIASLSTFSNFRGFDASNLDFVIYDEFIKNKGEKSIKDEGFALMNVYETVNRNRELFGSDAVRLICLSNANLIANDVFMDLGLADKVEFMKKKGKNQYYDYGRGIAIYDLSDSEISKQKKNTALYKLDAGGAYSDMALGNEFEDYDASNVRSEPLQEYVPLVLIGDLCLYKHKSDNGKFYGTTHRSGTPPVFKMTDLDKQRFIRKYDYLWEAYIDGRIHFDAYSNMKTFEGIYI